MQKLICDKCSIEASGHISHIERPHLNCRGLKGKGLRRLGLGLWRTPEWIEERRLRQQHTTVQEPTP